MPAGSSPIDSWPTFPPISIESRCNVVANIGCASACWLMRRVKSGPYVPNDAMTSAEDSNVEFWRFEMMCEGVEVRKSKEGKVGRR